MNTGTNATKPTNPSCLNEWYVGNINSCIFIFLSFSKEIVKINCFFKFYVDLHEGYLSLSFVVFILWTSVPIHSCSLWTIHGLCHRPVVLYLLGRSKRVKKVKELSSNTEQLIQTLYQYKAQLLQWSVISLEKISFWKCKA